MLPASLGQSRHQACALEDHNQRNLVLLGTKRQQLVQVQEVRSVEVVVARLGVVEAVELLVVELSVEFELEEEWGEEGWLVVRALRGAEQVLRRRCPMRLQVAGLRLQVEPGR